jgi:hypothetical protein
VARLMSDRVSGAALGLLACLCGVDTQAQSQSRGDASLRLEYQYIGTGAYQGDGFVAGYWTTDSHVLLLSGDYALSERWTIYAALPYVKKRFNPEAPVPGLPDGDPHDPTADYWVDFIPPDRRFIDDGNYHGGLQDLSLGLMYRAVDGPAWTVSPYIGYAVPASDYPFYAKAAIGQNLWSFPVGVSVRFVPYFSDWHFRGNLAYVFSEEPLNINVDYWLGFLSAGYWFKPNFSVDVFLSTKYLRNGLILPWDYTDDPTFSNYPADFGTELWYHHDRLLRHRILNLGVSIDYFLNEKYQLSGSYFETIWADQTNEVDNGFSIALTRYFSRD